MINFTNNGKSSSKCYVTHGTMGHLDKTQPPTKRKPYSSILSQPFIHKAELLLPPGGYEMIKSDLDRKLREPVYARVIMPLKNLLEGEFFNEYIKRGNCLMLSEGRPGIDNVYSLKDGILTLRLDKDSYERAGLAGKPDGVKGKRGTRPRWIIEINLRLPSMLHGKKGFDRIVHAFKNVLTQPVTWLFSEVRLDAPFPGTAIEHLPAHTASVCIPRIRKTRTVKTPEFQAPSNSNSNEDFDDYAVEVREWLALVTLDSPRLDVNDEIDPYLSRYTPPESSTEGVQLDRVTWEGFLDPSWAHKALVEVLAAKCSLNWFAFCFSSFPTKLEASTRDCTFLKLSGRDEYILWEVEED